MSESSESESESEGGGERDIWSHENLKGPNDLPHMATVFLPGNIWPQETDDFCGSLKGRIMVSFTS